VKIREEKREKDSQYCHLIRADKFLFNLYTQYKPNIKLKGQICFEISENKERKKGKE
jgi:hypothetical protein